MIKKIIATTLTCLVCISLPVLAQEVPVNNSGSFYGDVFLNANHNFDKNLSAFRLNRLHFGYKYFYNESLYFNGMIESAREDYEPDGDYNGITNLFEFCLGFKVNKIEGKFGLIGTELNQLQEKLWKQRNIDKVFADKYGFAPTNDFGGMIIFKPIDILSADLAVVNGDGHKNPQADSTFRYALGLTLQPIEGVFFRLYNDLMYAPEAIQINSIAILGYQSPEFSFGAEWNKQFNHTFVEDLDYGGISVYATYNVKEDWRLFGRFDDISFDYPMGYSPNPIGGPDAKLIIAGLQYQINEKISLAIDSRNWIDDLSNTTKSFLFVDVALGF